MGKTINRYDDLMKGLYPPLVRKYDSVELKVREDGETFDLQLEKGKKAAVVHFDLPLVAEFFGGDHTDAVIEKVDALFKEATKKQ